MKKAILFFTAAGLLMTSCQNFKKAEGGLEYKIVDDNAKEKAVSGDLLSVDMIVKSDRDSVLQSTFDMGIPQIVQLYASSPKTQVIQQACSNMSVKAIAWYSKLIWIP